MKISKTDRLSVSGQASRMVRAYEPSTRRAIVETSLVNVEYVDGMVEESYGGLSYALIGGLFMSEEWKSLGGWFELEIGHMVYR